MAISGSLWIEGTSLHWSSAGTDYYCEGGSLGTPAGAMPGSIWIDGPNIRYIDESGVYRSIGDSEGVVIDPGEWPGMAGSLWIEDLGSTLRLFFMSDDTPIPRLCYVDAHGSESI
jgi:hypothetical protein